MKNFSKYIGGFLITLFYIANPAFAQDTTVRTGSDEELQLSRGGLLLEPFITYQTTTTQMRTSQLPIVTDDTSGTSQGFGVGGRIGGHVYESLWLAGDIRYSRTSMSDSFYGSADADNFDYGATLGVQTPWAGLRLWGTYIIGGFSDPTEGISGLDVRFEDLTGFRVGAGIHVAAVSISLEYHEQNFGNTAIQGVGSLAVREQTSIDSDSAGYTLSLGFPLEM